jgi:N-methylhydantoinase A
MGERDDDAIQVAVDVGGTFTDVVAHSFKNGRTLIAKTLSSPDASAESVVEGVRLALRADARSPADVIVIRYGTTVATNAVLERRVAKTALIITKGFSDLLYVGRQSRPSLYDLRARHPAPLVPRHFTFELDERTNWAGVVERPVSRDEIETLLPRLRSENVEAIAVCLLHSYANGENEVAVRDMLVDLLPEVPVCISSEICCEMGEYERASTTVTNASLMPLVAGHVQGLRETVGAFAPGCQIYVMQSNGGAMGPEVAAAKSVHTMFSGPAGGLMGAHYFARQAGIGNAITLDVGGTSADVGVIVNDSLQQIREGSIGGLPIRVPQLEIHSVGSGGGSIAWIDDGGALRVGPRSAGANPGPICYRGGGKEPTLTDAHVVLGNIGPNVSLGGRVAIDAAAAADGLQRSIAAPLKMGLANTAAGILEVADAIMLRAIRVLTVQRGLDPRDFTLIAMGGAGPLHSVSLSRFLGIRRVLVPPVAGVFSALGMLTTPVKHDFVRTQIAPADKLTSEGIRQQFGAIESEALKVMEREGFSQGEITLHRWAELRYRGQGFELPVGPLDQVALDNPASVLTSGFHKVHEHRYGFAFLGESIELVNLGITATGLMPEFQFSPAQNSARSIGSAKVDERSVWFGGASCVTAVFDRERLPAQAQVRGPAVIESVDSTTVLPPGAIARVDDWGALIITTME